MRANTLAYFVSGRELDSQAAERDQQPADAAVRHRRPESEDGHAPVAPRRDDRAHPLTSP
jgi:hypothetical protein